VDRINLTLAPKHKFRSLKDVKEDVNMLKQEELAVLFTGLKYVEGDVNFGTI